jgi:hypothetical protein
VAGGTVLLAPALSPLFPSAETCESKWTDGRAAAAAAALWAALAKDDILGADAAAGGVEATGADGAGWLPVFSEVAALAWTDAAAPIPVPLVLVTAPPLEIRTPPLGSRSTLGFFWPLWLEPTLSCSA